MKSYYLPRIAVITIMRFLEDEVSAGDKLIPFLVANDVFELDPGKGNIKCLRNIGLDNLYLIILSACDIKLLKDILSLMFI